MQCTYSTLLLTMKLKQGTKENEQVSPCISAIDREIVLKLSLYLQAILYMEATCIRDESSIAFTIQTLRWYHNCVGYRKEGFKSPYQLHYYNILYRLQQLIGRYDYLFSLLHPLTTDNICMHHVIDQPCMHCSVLLYAFMRSVHQNTVQQEINITNIHYCTL